MVGSRSRFIITLIFFFNATGVAVGASSSHRAFTSGNNASPRAQQRHPTTSFEKKKQGVVIDLTDSNSVNNNDIRGNHDIDIIDTARKSHLNAVVWVSLANFLVYTLRPDDYVSWQMRLPRACWELSILIVAKTAEDSPTLLGLLALMTGSTAMTDIFIWAPLFASFSSFQTCKGGWFTGKPYHCVSDYSKGFGRLLVSMQSLFGGLFYLLTTVVVWNEFWAMRQEHKLERQVTVLEAWAKKNESVASLINNVQNQ